MCSKNSLKCPLYPQQRHWLPLDTLQPRDRELKLFSYLLIFCDMGSPSRPLQPNQGHPCHQESFQTVEHASTLKF